MTEINPEQLAKAFASDDYTDRRERKLFHRAHYEILAARFNEALYAENLKLAKAVEAKNAQATIEATAAIAALGAFAIMIAKRLEADNSLFDPKLFLRKSSELSTIPLEELWEEQ